MDKSKRGESLVAIFGDSWKGKRRPRKWRGKVWGLVVHTTGAGLPAKALNKGQHVWYAAQQHYIKTHGTHYVVSYKGAIVQVANEDMRANGVGMKTQIAATKLNKKLWSSISFNDSQTAKDKWFARWYVPYGFRSPLDLYPGKYANSCYVHVEMPPCAFWANGSLHKEAEPHKLGLRFTTEQHDAIVKLSIDIADRNNFPDGWWETSRLVGHEDLSPISRGTKDGCWDPGFLRNGPWFDFLYVKNEIKRIMDARKASMVELDRITEFVRTEPNPPVFENVVRAFTEWVTKAFTRKEK
jgi:hypothetical protein